MIVVTGGAGFIGSHLCERLLDNGHSVRCLDNLSTGRMSNIKPLMERDEFEFELFDVRDPISSDEPVSGVFHLASPASPPAYQAGPIGCMLTNVVGTHNALHLAHRHKARLVLASTSEVYGDPEEHPQKESYLGSVSTTGPRGCYDNGKRAAETLACDYHRFYGTDVGIARIFNTYGPRMAPDDGRVMTNFVYQALRGDELTVYGDGEQTRSFCYISDMVEGLMALMFRTTETGPINLGNPHEISINQLASLILNRFDNGIVYEDLPVDDPQQRQPDITKARELLQWEPQVELSDGITRFIEYAGEYHGQ